MPRVERITGRDNRRLVTARKVREGHARDRIFIEGKRLVKEALLSDLEIDDCFLVADFSDEPMRESVGLRTTAIAELPENIFRSVADTKEPQGIILIAKRPQTGKERITIPDAALPVVVLVHEVNNPSNLGAVLRTAEAAGVAGVIVSRNSADPFSPKALRGSMGASLRIPIWDDADYDDALEWARGMNLAVSAASVRSEKSYTSVDWELPRMLIFGSEAHGLDDEQLRDVDERISIPIEEPVESLNLAVSAGIILFEAKRQHVRAQN